jgi:hypothetical protein
VGVCFRGSQTDVEQQNANQHTVHARYVEPVRAYRLSAQFISASVMSSMEKQLTDSRQAQPHRVALLQEFRHDIGWPFGYRATALPNCCDRGLKPLDVAVRPCPPNPADSTEARDDESSAISRAGERELSGCRHPVERAEHQTAVHDLLVHVGDEVAGHLREVRVKPERPAGGGTDGDCKHENEHGGQETNNGTGNEQASVWWKILQQVDR